MSRYVAAATGVAAAGALLIGGLLAPLEVRHSAPFGFSLTLDAKRAIAVHGGFVTANFPDFNRIDLDLRAYDLDADYDLTVHVRPAQPGLPDVRTVALSLDGEQIRHDKPPFADPFVTIRFPPIADSTGRRYYVWVETGPRNRDDVLALWSIKSYSRVSGREVLAALLADPPGDAAPQLVRAVLVWLLVGLVVAFGWLIAALTTLALAAPPVSAPRRAAGPRPVPVRAPPGKVRPVATKMRSSHPPAGAPAPDKAAPNQAGMRRGPAVGRNRWQAPDAGALHLGGPRDGPDAAGGRWRARLPPWATPPRCDTRSRLPGEGLTRMHDPRNGRPSAGNGRGPNGAARKDGGVTVVMGAGPGGLCSAYVLSKAGVPVTVLEKAPFVGGLARTIRRQTEHGEFRFDIGGHRWFTKNDELNDLFREVVAEELLWVNRISRIYFDGRYVDYPLKISNALKAIGPVTSAKAMADYARTRVAHRLRPRPIVSMEDAYIDQFGPTLYKLFFQRYSEKVWGLPCDQMSGDWVSQRSKGMSLLTAVKDAVVPTRGKVVSLIDEFMYPKFGFGRFSERMADAVTAMGNRIRLGAGVERVHREGNRVVAVTVGTDGATERVEAENFISSIPLTLLAKIVDPPPPADVLAAADKLTFRNIITVNLMLKKRQVTPDTWLYVHDRNILFGRFHEPKNWSPAMVPGDEYTSLVVEYFCSFGDHIWGMTEEQLVEQTIKHLIEDLGFISRDEVIGGFTVRAPRAYPAYVIGYQEPLERIKAFVDELENLQIIGRYGTFRYNNTDHSIETGLLAAKNILGERHDLDQVNADKEYHEIKRVPEPVGTAARR